MPRALARLLLVALIAACGTRPPGPALVRTGKSVPAVPAPAVAPLPSQPAVVVSASAGVGTADPVVVEAASPDGRWAVLCQARYDTDGDGRISVTLGARGELLGDKMQSYFVEGAGAGEPIDEFLTSDRTGRFVATIRSGRLSIFDTVGRRSLDLSARGADIRADAANYLPHRAVTFDARGERLLYLRRDPDRTRAVLLDLERGSEAVIDPGSGAVWRAELLSGAVVLYVVTGDSNGNGRLDFPVPETAASNWRCRGPIPRFDAWQSRGDAIEPRVASSGVTDALPVPGFVGMFGSDFVVREPNGRLVLQRRGSPNQTLVTVAELAAPKCGARILQGDSIRRLLLLACTKAPGRSPVELVGEGYRNDLKVSVEPRANDVFSDSAQRLFAFYPGAQALLVDFENRRTTTLETGETVIAVHDSKVLTRRGNLLSIRDLGSGGVVALPGQLAELGDVLHQPPASYVTPQIVDLSNGEIVATLPPGARPLALTTDGRALLPPRSADAMNVAMGPLVWTTPSR